MARNSLLEVTDDHPAGLTLNEGSSIAVIGSGPAGSFFSYFVLQMAERAGIEVHVDLYEPRDFTHPAPQGCNMCGGIISESLVQLLATEGINLPPTVVQRGIDSYMLHMDVGSVRIEPPLNEKRIGAVHRGPGPKGVKERKWESFDGHLQGLALERGAHLVPERMEELGWEEGGQPRITTKEGSAKIYDLVAVAVGVNSPALKQFQDLVPGYQTPATTKTHIREYYLGEETIEKCLGSSMHVFLLNIPRLEFAALIPKGDYVTVCLLGEEIDKELIESFLDAPEVKRCMPPDWKADENSCQCSPRINVQGAAQPFADRLVFIGDSGVTRLYKDGIGAAYRTAKAAATTAVFEGISAEDFRRHYWPACQAIAADNAIGERIFAATRQIQGRRTSRRALLRMIGGEQRKEGDRRRMSMVLWDTFTGSAPYRDCFRRTLHPFCWGRLLWDMGVSACSRDRDNH